MGQSQGQGLGLGQLLPPSSSSSPAILVNTHHQPEQKLDGAAPPTPDSVESLTTKLDDALKPAGWDSSDTGKSSGAEAVESPAEKLEQKSDEEVICWGVKPTWWDQDVKPTGWDDGVRSDQEVKPAGWEDGVRSDQAVKPTGWEDVKPTGWEDVKPTGWGDGLTSDQDVKPTGWEDVKPTGWEDGVRSDQDVKPTGWEDDVRPEMALPNDVNCEMGKRPKKPNRPDCSFYATGSCKYGLNCRFNHPPQRNRGYKGKFKKGSEATQIGVRKVPTIVNTEERVLDLSASAEAYHQSKTPKQMEKQEAESEGNGCHDYPKPEGNSNPVELMSSKEGKSEAICFPQRADKPDCSYYLKTGTCQFGSNCRFNHPSRGKVNNKNQSEPMKSSVSRGNKVGTTGKHAHFPVKTEPGPEELNFLGLPMRPGEMECNHFMRTGSCKFATSCRYHHPNPVPVTEQDTLSEYQSGASPQQHASGASELPMTSFPLPIASCGPLPHPSPPYTPGFYPLPTEGFYSCPGWNGYQVPTTPWTPPEMISGNPSMSTMSNGYVPTHQAPQIDEYPERPGQPVCQYFTRNGHCKFKSACKFHHPKTVHRVPSH